MNIPQCSICKKSFNTTSNKPLLLPICSHTFCANCIDTQFQKTKENDLICPLDDVVI